MKHGTRALVAVIAIGAVFIAKAQAEEKEPTAVVEIGGAGEWNLAGGSSFGPSAAVEFSPIKNFLLEVGVAPLFSGGHAEWGTDFLFKKSFDLSSTVEFEPGIGPEWSSGGKIAGEVSFEFMIWPSPERKFGYFLEPSYSYSFSSGHEQSLGMTVGLLIAIP
jgi:hypothetical protein